MLHHCNSLEANLAMKRQIPVLVLVDFSVILLKTGLCLSAVSTSSVSLTWLSRTSSGSASVASNSSLRLESLSSGPGSDDDAAAACLDLVFTRRATVGVQSRVNVRRHSDDFMFGVLVAAMQRETATGLVKLLAATSTIHCVARTNDSSSVSVHRSSLDVFTGGTPAADDVLTEIRSVQQTHCRSQWPSG